MLGDEKIWSFVDGFPEVEVVKKARVLAETLEQKAVQRRFDSIAKRFKEAM